MEKKTVDLINQLSEIYASIRKRVVDSGEMLESDIIFIKFYDKLINDMFSNKKEI